MPTGDTQTVFQLFLVLVSSISGAMIAIFAEPVRRWIYKPDLILEFKKETIGCISKTFNYNSRTNQTAKACYIRVKVSNKSKRNVMARDCSAYLIGVEKQNSQGEFCSTNYCDSIPLAWSCQGNTDRYKLMDVPTGVNQYIDVIETTSDSDIFQLQLQTMPFRYSEGLLKEKGTFRFTVQVSAQNIDPIAIKFEFSWDGQWDGFEVS